LIFLRSKVLQLKIATKVLPDGRGASADYLSTRLINPEQVAAMQGGCGYNPFRVGVALSTNPA
jgi:hypothetical protein